MIAILSIRTPLYCQRLLANHALLRPVSQLEAKHQMALQQAQQSFSDMESKTIFLILSKLQVLYHIMPSRLSWLQSILKFETTHFALLIFVS